VAVDRTAVGALPDLTHPTDCRLAIDGDETLLVTSGDDLRLWRVPRP
jgi:hypothetical protein